MKSFFASTDKENAQQAGYLFLIVNILGFVTTGLMGMEAPPGELLVNFLWGWAVGVAKKSKEKEMAFDYLCFFANEANHQADIGIGRFGVNPFRDADFQADV